MRLTSEEINDIIRKEYLDRVFIYEEFRECRYPGIRERQYAIGEYGTVFNLETERVIRPFKDNRPKKEYYRIRLAATEYGKRTNVSVHRLVAWEFCPGYSEKNNIVNHKNAFQFDNFYGNLEWCDISHNTKHAFNYGHYYDVRRKFDIGQVRHICELFEMGKSPAEVCKLLYNVDNTKKVLNEYNTIFNIYKRISYREVSKEYDF